MHVLTTKLDLRWVAIRPDHVQGLVSVLYACDRFFFFFFWGGGGIDLFLVHVFVIFRFLAGLRCTKGGTG
jgi:hypothetical protein